MSTGNVAAGVKRPEREVDHSPPSSAENRTREVSLSFLISDFKA